MLVLAGTLLNIYIATIKVKWSNAGLPGSSQTDGETHLVLATYILQHLNWCSLEEGRNDDRLAKMYKIANEN